MPARVVNDNAGSLTPRGVLGFIASMLAPTEDSGRSRDRSRGSSTVSIPCRCGVRRSEHARDGSQR
ncbi:hypothetical protein PSUM_04235 [Pseudomonas umsongensis]|uniref:Uncharacterized protein n=1 Tax=Pseudomonas umsongensis TaxID=198618 RepID=A0ABX4E0M8_9PSED|nr:hypothetical protein PSUM_04235 [Pseudomonas umsongensis]